MSSDHLSSIIEQVLEEVAVCMRQVPIGCLNQALALIESSPQIFMAGAGRSGLAMRAFGMRLMHLGKTVYVVGDTATPGITAQDLLILSSGSGRTASQLLLAQQARRLGAKILLFTTDATSPLAELADQRVVITAPSLHTVEGIAQHMSIQPMGALFEQSILILCDSLIVCLMQRIGVSAVEMFKRHANLE